MKVLHFILFAVFYSAIIHCGSAAGLAGTDDSKKNNSGISRLLLGLLAYNDQNSHKSNTVQDESQSFKVESHTPVASAMNVSTNPSLFVKFNLPYNSDTITTSTVKLMNSVTPVTISILKESTNSFFIQPSAYLEINKTYTVTLDSSIANTDGLTLGTNYSWSFTTFNSDPDSGAVTTLAGTGSAGSVDGTGTAASFSSPQHLTMNTTEDKLYVTDTGNHRIRTVVVASGLVTNVAGLSLGYTTGTGTVARFNSPKGIFRNSANTFYITDSGNNGVRVMTVANAVTNTFGTNVNTAGYVVANSATTNRYRNPEGIAIDFLSGVYYTVDTGNHCIRKSTATGMTNPANCFAGANPVANLGTSGFLNGLGVAARFNNPKGIAIDSVGNIFISDSGNHSIRMITPAGVVSTVAGNGSSGYTNGVGSAATFNSPTDIAIYGNNVLFVVDGGNCAIRKLVLDDTKVSATVSTYAGPTTDVTSTKCGFVNGTRLTSRFNNPTGLWLASNKKIYVTDTGNHSIRVITE